VISREKLAQFGNTSAAQPKQESAGTGFDMEGYLSKHGFEVLRRKLWQSRPGGQIYELAQCPFNPDHTDGSAAFTILNGVPGFTCKHNGCCGKTIKDILAIYPADQPTAAAEPEASEERKTQAQILCELAANVQLFHDSQQQGYAIMPVRGHHEVWALRRKAFKSWLLKEFYDLKGKPPSSQALQDAIGVLEAKALFDWPQDQLFVRVAERGDAIYIDLCNDNWEVVEITARGWRVISDPPVRFRRAKGMLPLPCPVKGGSLSLLREFINIGDDTNWILFVACLVAAGRPRGPYPILILHGEQGSAKSTTEKLYRSVLDPSVALVRTLPRDERDLLITASNSQVLAYDNLSGLPQSRSDALCRIATGGGFATRELYTDSEEVFFDVTRPVVLNGIDYLADRPDLAERAVILNLPRIEKTARREEAKLYADFQAKLPLILGALYDAISTALRRLPDVTLPYLPRMADFAVWVVAAAPACGFSAEEFLAAYDGNQAEAVQDTIEGDPVAASIFALLGHLSERTGTDRWEGICKALLPALAQYVDEDAKRERDWPKTPRSLSSRLRRLAPFLRESGIDVRFPPKGVKGAKGKRELIILRIPVQTTATTASTATHESNHSSDQGDTAEQPGGGRASEVAVQSPPAEQPPPNSTSPNCLNGNGNRTGVAEVAVEAVGCSTVLNGHADAVVPSYRVDLCARCGRVDWLWVDGAWVCPKCGEPARGQHQPGERERIEL
jgi:hypothetical protein